MLSLQLISLGTNPLPSPQSPTLITSRTPFSQTRYRRSVIVVVQAQDKRDQQSEQSDYEIDEEKAREALEQLDRRLQSLSRKRDPPPKVKVRSASDVEVGRGPMVQDEALEMNGSFLGYTAVALLFFSIFYNVVFYTVIKPSIDGPNLYPEDDTPLVRTEIRF